MLKVIEGGVLITLTGASHKQEMTLVISAVLIVLAVLVAFAMVFLPIQGAIGALAVLVIGCFGFNRWRQQQSSNSPCISTGTVEIRKGQLMYLQMGKRQTVTLDVQDYVEIKTKELLIYTPEKQQKCQICGFETDKEAEVAGRVLQGMALTTKNANIRMDSSK